MAADPRMVSGDSGAMRQIDTCARDVRSGGDDAEDAGARDAVLYPVRAIRLETGGASGQCPATSQDFLIGDELWPRPGAGIPTEVFDFLASRIKILIPQSDAAPDYLRLTTELDLVVMSDRGRVHRASVLTDPARRRGGAAYLVVDRALDPRDRYTILRADAAGGPAQ